MKLRDVFYLDKKEIDPAERKSTGQQELNWLLNRATEYGEFYTQNYNPQLYMLSNEAAKWLGSEELVLKKGRSTGRSVTMNKPNAMLWTSTAIKAARDQYSSSWTKWVLAEMPEWFNRIGYLLNVKSGVKILSLNSNSDAKRIYNAYHLLYPEKVPELRIDKYEGYSFRNYFPWDLVAQDFDAVHHIRTKDVGTAIPFTYGWDAESTAWLTTDFLDNLGQVTISRS